MIQHNNLGTLELLATECPFVYGQGVLAARALLMANDGQKRLFVNACELPIQNGAGNRLGGEVEGFVWTDFNNLGLDEIEEEVNAETIGTFSSNSYKVYPNPFGEDLTIEIASNNNQEWTLLDVTGRIVATGKTEGVQTKIDCSNISSGSYILRLSEIGQLQIIK
jgi:hypothetical protein